MFSITLISYVYHVLFILGVSWREGPWEIKEAAGAGGQVHQVHSKLRRFKRKDFQVKDDFILVYIHTVYLSVT